MISLFGSLRVTELSSSGIPSYAVAANVPHNNPTLLFDDASVAIYNTQRFFDALDSRAVAAARLRAISGRGLASRVPEVAALLLTRLLWHIFKQFEDCYCVIDCIYI